MRSESLKVKLPLVLLGALAFVAGFIGWKALRHRWITLIVGMIAGCLIAARVHGTAPVLIVLACLGFLLTAWRFLHASSWRLWLWWPLRGTWRKHHLYKREWAELMATTELLVTHGEDLLYPEVVSVKSTAITDRVRVKLLAGQVLADFAANADRFAACFEAVDCRVRTIPARSVRDGLHRWLCRFPWYATRFGGTERPVKLRKRVIELWLLTSDPLVEPVPLFDIPRTADLNLSALPVALAEDGAVATLRLLANHILVIGATGAGKGSVLWSIVRALADGIRTKLVELWLIDPKGGMEFAAGQPLCTRYCYGDDAPMTVEDVTRGRSEKDRMRVFETAYAEFLEDAVDILRERQSRLRGWLRTHKPSIGDPLIVIMIDEIASLTAYVTDRDVKKRIAAALNILLSQGRAVGVLVIGAGQDARKEVIEMRGLFPTRILMRVNEPEDVDLTLGKGARDRGARADEIPVSTPGVVFLQVETVPEPIRARFGYISDPDIDVMAKLYAPGSPEPDDGPEPPTPTPIRRGRTQPDNESLKEAA